ncbi:MAG: hypothetical protein HY506_02695 [Candidatus Yanofskybacteria bacterium]|nr:hypothetical protein [Candidatus Yanofskybacteria bacterium]
MLKLTVILIVVVLAAGGVFAWFTFLDEPEITACTEEAKLCPDGSYVGRVGPNCEFADCPQEKDDGGNFKTTSTVMGKVSIGPLCPVEPCPTNPFNDDIYSGRQLIFTPDGGGRPVDLPLYIKLNSDGSFKDEIPAGNYEVTLSRCDYLGCRYSMPKFITVEANKTLELNIDIDTGIR